MATSKRRRSVHTEAHSKLVSLLVEARDKAGISQVQLAKRLGVSQPWIVRFEAGQRRLDVIEYLRYAKALGFDPVKTLAKLLRAGGI